MRTARSASKVSPVRNSSCAARACSRGSTVSEITAGTTPIRTSENANVAVSAQVSGVRAAVPNSLDWARFDRAALG